MFLLYVNILEASLVLFHHQVAKYPRAVHVFTIGGDRKISEHKAIRDDLALKYQLVVVKASTPEYENFQEGWKGII